MWRLISKEDLWNQIHIQRYIEPNSAEDWIGNPNKSINNASILLKVLTITFPLIGRLLAWKVCNEAKAKISIDPWISSGAEYKLPEAVINSLQSRPGSWTRKLLHLPAGLE